VVLTAAIVGLGIAVVVAVRGGTTAMGNSISAELADRTTFPTSPPPWATSSTASKAPTPSRGAAPSRGRLVPPAASPGRDPARPGDPQAMPGTRDGGNGKRAAGPRTALVRDRAPGGGPGLSRPFTRQERDRPMKAVFGLVLVTGLGLAGTAVVMVRGHFEAQAAQLAQTQAAAAALAAAAVPTVQVYAVTRPWAMASGSGPRTSSSSPTPSRTCPGACSARSPSSFPRARRSPGPCCAPWSPTSRCSPSR
jgi:hypothetical protein